MITLYDEEGNITFSGVGSNYMCNLKEGDEVTMTGPAEKTFYFQRQTLVAIFFFAQQERGFAPFYGMTMNS